MRLEVAAFTERGKALANKLFDGWQPETVGWKAADCPLSEWAKRCFSDKSALIFIGACGIAVRTIAPFVRDKLSDSPVLVLDESGRYVIPILSGHVGGANELAERIARKIQAEAVITTATDQNGVFAADVFAQKNRLTICNKEGIAAVSSKLLRGERVSISIQDGAAVAGWENALERTEYPPLGKTDIVISTEEDALKKGILRLRPKPYVLGLGCRRGKEEAEIAEWLRETLPVPLTEIAYLASVDRKKDESGLRTFAERNRIPFLTFSAEELSALSGDYSGSDFVKQQVGVDNVCERAAMAAAGMGGTLVLRKQSGNGITAALAKRKWSLTFDGTETNA